MTDKTGYKFSIKANQSLSNGMIAFEGYFAFDTFDEFLTNKDLLTKMFQETQAQFEKEGFKCSSIIPNNMKDLANSKSKGAEALKNEAAKNGDKDKK